jgi:hypothetical protein
MRPLMQSPMPEDHGNESSRTRGWSEAILPAKPQSSPAPRARKPAQCEGKKIEAKTIERARPIGAEERIRRRWFSCSASRPPKSEPASSKEIIMRFVVPPRPVHRRSCINCHTRRPVTNIASREGMGFSRQLRLLDLCSMQGEGVGRRLKLRHQSPLQLCPPT